MTEPQGDYEYWAERQAVQCERHIEEIKKSVDRYVQQLLERQSRPSLDYLHLITGPLHEAAMRISNYATMADSFRRGRWAREEHEAYEKAYGHPLS